MTVDKSVEDLVVGILGGTGPQGQALGYRLAGAGQQVLIGSRRADRGVDKAEELARAVGDGARVGGGDNASVAADCDLAIVAVPYEGHRDLLAGLAEPLAGKIVVDCVNPLGFDPKGPYPLQVPEGSAAQQAAEVLPGSTVIAAFHHVSSVLMSDPSVETIDLDVMVLGEDREAVGVVVKLAGRIPGMRGVYAGRLRLAHQVEALTGNLIAVNRRYKTQAGFRVTGV
jgi:NADPH-dependent F420 reductase